MKSRSKVAGAAFIIAALGLAGCSAGGDGDGATTLEFQTNLASDSPILAVLAEITDAYEADHEGVRIELVPQTSTYEADLRVRLASNDVPDIWSTHGWSLLRYSEFLEPLNDRSWAGNFNPALDATFRNGDDEFFALPVNTDIAGIVYNQSVLDDLGIDVTTLTTWDAFDAAAAKIADAGITPISSSGKDSWFAGNIADFMASGAYAQDELDELAAGTFVPEGYTTMLDRVAEWAEAGAINPDFSSAAAADIARALAEGDTAFVFVQNYLVADALAINPDAQLGFFPIPGFVTDPYFVGGEGYAYGVSKTSEGKEEALDYIDFLAQPENLSKLATAVGGAPGLTDATTDLGALQDSYDAFVTPGDFRLEPYFDRVYLPNGLWDTMVTTTSGVITGQSDVQSAVEQVAAEFDAKFGS